VCAYIHVCACAVVGVMCLCVRVRAFVCACVCACVFGVMLGGSLYMRTRAVFVSARLWGGVTTLMLNLKLDATLAI